MLFERCVFRGHRFMRNLGITSWVRHRFKNTVRFFKEQYFRDEFVDQPHTESKCNFLKTSYVSFF